MPRDIFSCIFPSTFIIVIGVFVFAFIMIIKTNIRRSLGVRNLAEVFTEQEILDETTPKSLNGMDPVYLPQIIRDFPDFNPTLVRTKVREKLREVLKDKQDFAIHGIVISNYTRTNVEYTIFFQAAVQYRVNGRMNQKRYCLNYSFLLATDEGRTIAANCPNCGGVISSTNQKVCEFCDSRLVNVLGNSWEFTDVYEG